MIPAPLGLLTNTSDLPSIGWLEVKHPLGLGCGVWMACRLQICPQIGAANYRKKLQGFYRFYMRAGDSA